MNLEICHMDMLSQPRYQGESEMLLEDKDVQALIA